MSDITKKKYFKFQILVHEFSTIILNHFCVPVVSFWITPALSTECKYYVFEQYWYIRMYSVHQDWVGWNLTHAFLKSCFISCNYAAFILACRLPLAALPL